MKDKSVVIDPLPPFVPIFTLPVWATYLDSLAALHPSKPAPSNGKRLLAMGDSWFNYLPHYDVIWWLRAKYGYACDSVAVIGEKLVHMAPPPGWDPRNPTKIDIGKPGHQLADLAIAMRALDGQQKDEVAAVLVSGGGNDIADKDTGAMQALLKDFADGPPYINDVAFQKIVRTEMYGRLHDILIATIELLDLYLPNRTVPIFIHGYAWPVPDGRPGPIENWLKPAFVAHGYTDLQLCTDIMQELIDDLRQLVLDVITAVTPSGAPQRAHYLDVRPALDNTLADEAYKRDWQNELHPTIPRGFEKVADMFATKLGAVLAAPRGSTGATMVATP